MKRRNIFVFGSNLRGVHGRGSAEHAYREHFAEWGVAEGRTGDAYAIPTKEASIWKSRPLADIQTSVTRFLNYAREHPELDFSIVAIGCGLAGYKRDQIRPMFDGMPDNCTFLEESWK